MRKLLIPMLLTGMTAGAAMAQQDPPQGTLVAIAVDEIFIPNGFDDNDESLVVLDGYLPNACYRLAYNDVQRDPVTNKQYVIQYARRYPGICIQARVPFFSEATLGVMPAGEFKVTSIGAADKTLTVAEATNAGPDDHTYAPVDSARIERDEATNRYFAVIQGRFTNSCMAFDEVRLHNSGKTLELLPIIKMVDSADCREVEMPFSWMVDMPADIAEGRHLLHVRSLNGKSVNTMFSVYGPQQ